MSEFSLTVIGHWGAYPNCGEATSCYLLQAEETSVLLDCGSGALSVLQEHMSLADIDAVILSHYHADHMADLGCLQYAALIDMDLHRRQNPLMVYGHDEYAHTNILSFRDCVLGATYNRNSLLEIGPFRFSFVPTAHPDPCFAIRADCGSASLVYSGDTEPCWELVPFSEGADLLLCETTPRASAGSSPPTCLTGGCITNFWPKPRPLSAAKPYWRRKTCDWSCSGDARTPGS